MKKWIEDMNKVIEICSTKKIVQSGRTRHISVNTGIQPYDNDRCYTDKYPHCASVLSMAKINPDGLNIGENVVTVKFHDDVYYLHYEDKTT